MKMKLPKMTFLLLLLLGGAAATRAQAPKSVLSEEFSYTMVSSDGTNGSAVAWHPKSNVYVTVIAGNMDFPLESFGPGGKAVAQSTAGFDWRGLWYNPASNKIEGNGAGEEGWAWFQADGDGFGDVVSLRQGQFQPDFQSVGCFDPEKKQVVFIDYSCDGLGMYAYKNPKKVKQLSLDWNDVEIGNVNSTTVGYTGHAGYEFVLLDYVDGKLEFFNRKGQHTGSSKLPESAPLYDLFAFSFANDRAFLYDKDNRIWYSYRVW